MKTVDIAHRWAPTINIFLADDDADGRGVVARDDGWSITSGFGSLALAGLLAKAPGPFAIVCSYSDWSRDTRSRVEACEAELAVLDWSEHRAAGSWATLTVYATADAYDRAVRAARAARDEAVAPSADATGA